MRDYTGSILDAFRCAFCDLLLGSCFLTLYPIYLSRRAIYFVCDILFVASGIYSNLNGVDVLIQLFCLRLQDFVTYTVCWTVCYAILCHAIYMYTINVFVTFFAVWCNIKH